MNNFYAQIISQQGRFLLVKCSLKSTFLNHPSISNDSWGNLQQTFRPHFTEFAQLINNTANNPTAFLMVFERLEFNFLSSANYDPKALILSCLSQSPPDFLAAIKEILPKIIQAVSLSTLNQPNAIKALISKAYPSDKYEEFQSFISSLDKERGEIIAHSIENDLHLMFDIPPASVKFKSDLKHIIQHNNGDDQDTSTADGENPLQIESTKIKPPPHVS